MSEKENLSKAQLAQRKRNKITIVISAILAVAIVVGLGTWWFLNRPPATANNFESNVPLSEDLAVTGLQWNSRTGDFANTPTGSWVLDEETGRFTNEDYPGCVMFWVRTGAGAKDSISDAENTQSFIAGLNGEQGEDIWVPVEGEPGKLEFSTSRFVTETDEFAWVVARYVSSESTIITGSMSCTEEDDLNELISSNDVAEFGMSLEVS